MTTRQRLLWRRGGRADELVVTTSDGRSFEVSILDRRAIVDCVTLPDGRRSVLFPSGRQIAGHAARGADGRVEAWVGGRRLRVELADPLSELAAHSEKAAGGSTVVTAQIPGRVVEVRVSQGDLVDPGATLLVLEAMKMQNEIRAESRARVESVECRAGQAVETGTVLLRLGSDGANGDSSRGHSKD
jgi:biotin carboxyl carrier protein